MIISMLLLAMRGQEIKGMRVLERLKSPFELASAEHAPDRDRRVRAIQEANACLQSFASLSIQEQRSCLGRFLADCKVHFDSRHSSVDVDQRYDAGKIDLVAVALGRKPELHLKLSGYNRLGFLEKRHAGFGIEFANGVEPLENTGPIYFSGPAYKKAAKLVADGYYDILPRPSR